MFLLFNKPFHNCFWTNCCFWRHPVLSIRHVRNEERALRETTFVHRMLFSVNWTNFLSNSTFFLLPSKFFTNRLSIQSIHRCFAIPIRTQFSLRLVHGEFSFRKRNCSRYERALSEAYFLIIISSKVHFCNRKDWKLSFRLWKLSEENPRRHECDCRFSARMKSNINVLYLIVLSWKSVEIHPRSF